MERIRILKKLNKPYDDIASVAYEVAKKLKSHEAMKQRIDSITES